MKKLIILILTVVVFTQSIFAAYPQTDVQSIFDSQPYREFVYFMYNSPSEDKILSEIDNITTFIESSSFDSDSKLITKSQVYKIVGKYLITNDLSLDGKSGKSFTEDGIDAIDKVKDINKNEEALIAKADLLGNYIMISSKYVFSKGIESGKVIDKAIKMNKENPRSILIDSEKLIFAPSLFGGDKEKAKQQLKELIGNYQLLPKDAFEAVRNLGIIADKEGKDDFADTYFSYAEEIFPNSQEIEYLRSN
jgi:hypothetical protein